MNGFISVQKHGQIALRAVPPYHSVVLKQDKIIVSYNLAHCLPASQTVAAHVAQTSNKRSGKEVAQHHEHG
jgi:hypothetical protein